VSDAVLRGDFSRPVGGTGADAHQFDLRQLRQDAGVLQAEHSQAHDTDLGSSQFRTLPV